MFSKSIHVIIKLHPSRSLSTMTIPKYYHIHRTDQQSGSTPRFTHTCRHNCCTIDTITDPFATICLPWPILLCRFASDAPSTSYIMKSFSTSYIIKSFFSNAYTTEHIHDTQQHDMTKKDNKTTWHPWKSYIFKQQDWKWSHLINNKQLFKPSLFDKKEPSFLEPTTTAIWNWTAMTNWNHPY